MDNLDKASAAFTKHIVWLRVMFLLPFLALVAAGIIAAFLKPARP